MYAEIKKNNGASFSSFTPYRFGKKQVSGEFCLKAAKQNFIRAVPVVSGPFQGPLSTIPNANIPIIIINKNEKGTIFAAEATRPGGC